MPSQGSGEGGLSDVLYLQHVHLDRPLPPAGQTGSPFKASGKPLDLFPRRARDMNHFVAGAMWWCDTFVHSMSRRGYPVRDLIVFTSFRGGRAP